MSKQTSVLLIGGAGYIGRSLSTRLCELGMQVQSLTRGYQTDPTDGTPTHSGGIENIELLRRLLPQVDCVIHLASASTPSLSLATPSLEGRLNLAPTLCLLEEMQHYPRVRLIYFSSGGAIYGNPGDHSATEQTDTKPLSYYGAGKLATEVFLRCFTQLHGNPVVILRPSNVYGPRQPLYRGFAVIRTMFQHLLDDTSMPIWGDGSIVRDFIYIDDVVAAIECVMANPQICGTFNVGSGVGHSLIDLSNLMREATGKSLTLTHTSARSIDVKRIVLDSSALQKECGWTPRVSLLEGMQRTWSWLISK